MKLHSLRLAHTVFILFQIGISASVAQEFGPLSDSLSYTEQRNEQCRSLAQYFKQEARDREISLDLLSIWPNGIKSTENYSIFLIGNLSNSVPSERTAIIQQEILEAFSVALMRWSKYYQIEIAHLDLALNITINDQVAPLIQRLSSSLSHLPIQLSFQFYPSSKSYLLINIKGL